MVARTAGIDKTEEITSLSIYARYMLSINENNVISASLYIANFSNYY